MKKKSSKPVSPSAKTPEPSFLDTGGELIVLADAAAAIRDDSSRILSEHYRVHTVSNGVDAVRFAHELHADLVLSNVMLPGLDGFEVLRSLKSDPETSTLPVILFSARARELSRAKSLHAGADDFLAKPFTTRDLLARVGAHLRLARVRAEAAEKERLLRAEADLERNRLIESFIVAPSGMALMSGPEHRFEFANAAFLELIGREHSREIVGRTVQELFPEIEQQGYLHLLKQVYETAEPFLATDREFRIRRPGGAEKLSYVTFSYQAVKNLAGEVEGVLAHTVDVTEQVMARNLLEDRVTQRTAELQAAEEKLRILTGKLLQAQDEERRRLARDLHDSAGQLLVALKMTLFTLEQQLKKKDPVLNKTVVSSMDLVDELSKELRTMSHLLHPPLLDEAGLASALRWYIEGFAERSGIHIDLDLDPKLPRLSREIETAIFRIVQESLTNISRHSGSESAIIRVEFSEGSVKTEIRDAGRGIPQFDQETGMPVKAGVGVQGMNERVRQLRGKFELHSGEKGTAVLVSLPTA